MANRLMANRVYTGKKDWKAINAVVAIGATGAPTLDKTKSFGVISVTRNSAGKYTFLFGVNAGGGDKKDAYKQVVGVLATFDTTGAAGALPAAPVVNVIADNTAAPATATAQIVCQSIGTTTAATDPASGEKLYITFIFADSGAP